MAKVRQFRRDESRNIERGSRPITLHLTRGEHAAADFRQTTARGSQSEHSHSPSPLSSLGDSHRLNGTADNGASFDE
jgi:hypothetical protein